MVQKIADKEVRFRTKCFILFENSLFQTFALYLVEVQVKEQYLSRGDMWRFTRKLVNTAVYLKKPLDIFGMR
jgi:hypothetical protein